jgi:hypothetical protein
MTKDDATMPTQYRYALDQAVDEFLVTSPRRDARQLRDFFRFLAQHPFTEGEQRTTDSDGRPCAAKLHDKFVITDRPDHAAKEVRILAVELG